GPRGDRGGDRLPGQRRCVDGDRGGAACRRRAARGPDVGAAEVIALEQASIFFDGTTGETRLSHPECVAFDAQGAAWCGGDRGEISRVEPDGSGIEQIASTGGFTLGVALDGNGALYS